jgi:predicted ester cyclase
VSAQENEALVRWFFEEAWGKGNLAAVDEYIAADYVEHTLPLGSQQGRDALKQFVTMYHEAFPDLKVTMHDIFGRGDRVVYRWSAGGTHLEEWMGIPPTGARGDARARRLGGNDLLRTGSGSRRRLLRLP